MKKSLMHINFNVRHINYFQFNTKNMHGIAIISVKHTGRKRNIVSTFNPGKDPSG